MEPKIRVWLDDDRSMIHHASAAQVADLTVTEADGTTDCGLPGRIHLVHHENVDMGKLCPGCQAVSGVRPPLAGQDLGPL